MEKNSHISLPTNVYNSRCKNDSIWLLSSGATCHLTSDEAHLIDVAPYVCPEGVVVGNGSLFPISQIGVDELDLNYHTLLLKNILQTLEVSLNLRSM